MLGSSDPWKSQGCAAWRAVGEAQSPSQRGCRVQAEVRADFLGTQLLPDTERERAPPYRQRGGPALPGMGWQGGSLGLGRPGPWVPLWVLLRWLFSAPRT